MKLLSSAIGVRVAAAMGSEDGAQRTLLSGIVHPHRLVAMQPDEAIDVVDRL